MTDLPEFHRLFDRRQIGPKPVELTANAPECAALARRFGLVSIGRLSARITLQADGDIIAASGVLHASVVQSCAVSGDDLPVTIKEPLTLRFVPERPITAEELELEEGELDEIAYDGHSFDLGEAVAQSLALAIDPYACGPEAEQAREKAGLNRPPEDGPFAALAALRKH